MLERNLADFDGARKNLYESTLDAATKIQPFAFGDKQVRLVDVGFDPNDDEDNFPDRYDYTAQADAMAARSTLGRRLRGTWQLEDPATGQVLQKQRRLLAVVPRVNEDGTMIYRGSRYAVLNQQRVKPSLFARVKKNAELETHVNVAPGTGNSHRYIFNPESSVFSINVGHSKIPMASLLRTLGISDDEMRAAWGDEIAEKNFAKNDRGAMQKLYERLVPKRLQVPNADPELMKFTIQQAISEAKVDPWSTKRTTGIETDRLSPQVMLEATKKVLALSRQEVDGDDRDHLAYKTTHTVEDLLPERIRLDRGSVVKKALREAIRRGNIGAIPPKLLQQHIQSGIFESSLGVQPEFANPLDGLDRATRFTSMGEGGLSSLDAVPMESRDVHMSHQGFIDPARTVESLKTGIDVNVVSGARRSADGRLITPVVNRKTGQIEYKTPEDLVDATVAFSDKDTEVPGYLVVNRGGQFDYAKPEEVDYVLPNAEDSMMSHLSNMVPGKFASVQNRLAMGARMIAQALPLREAEAPWVQSAVPGSGGQESYDSFYGNRVGAVRSSVGGTVKDVQPGFITVTSPEGDKRIPLHRSTPLGSKTRLYNKPVVKVGDQVQPNQLLATSNFTNSQGVAALGRNARVALMPWGDNYEDAFTVSRSFATKLTSDHAYRYRIQPEDGWHLDKNKYIGAIPSQFKKDQLEKLGDDGVIKEGQAVRPGDPLILAAAPKRGSTSQRITRKRGPSFTDQSLTWDHDVEGTVTDVKVLPNGERVVQVASFHPAQTGDKIADRFGAKGVVTVVDDEKMLRDKDGNPFDVVASDLGLISRSNVGRAADLLLGKVAAKRGKPILFEDFDTSEEIWDRAQRELKSEGLDDMEEVYDPSNNRKIPKVLVGNAFLMKLQHTTESKRHARGIGRYTQDDSPAKGGEEGGMAKRLSNQELNALMAHQAYEFIREGALVRGQRNEDYWARYMNGHEVPTPKVPMVYQKFVSYLKGIGVNPVKEGTKTRLMLLNDQDTMDLAGAREVLSGETVDANKDLKPIGGGLFDPKTFGDGTLWARYQLSEKIPHPLMEDPIRKLMGVTKKQYRDILAGESEYKTFGGGPDAITGYLGSLQLNKEIMAARAKLKDSRKTHREAAVVRLRYLRGLADRNIDPKSLMLQQIPIIPPVFRPVSKLSGKDAPLIDGMNLLYRDMIDADRSLKSIKSFTSKPANERLAVYDAVQAAMGLREPVDPELRQKKVTGLMGRLMGQHGPKTGFVQRKLLSGTVDMVGRGVIAPSAKLGLDEVGIPEEQAWESFRMPLIREMRRQGRPLSVAMKEFEQRSPVARNLLERVMDEKLVAMSRAPVLHKFGMLAFKPKIVEGSTVRMNPLVYQGYAADNDGDAVNFHVLMDDNVISEAKKKWVPSRTLLSPRDFKTPIFVPNQDHALGLYRASTDKDDKAHAVTYATLDDARKDFLRGKINVGTPVRILKPNKR